MRWQIMREMAFRRFNPLVLVKLGRSDRDLGEKSSIIRSDYRVMFFIYIFNAYMLQEYRSLL